MRIQNRYATSDSNPQNIKLIQDILDKFGIEYEYSENLKPIYMATYSINFYLYEDDLNFNEVKKALEEFDLNFWEGTIMERVDIENAEWFWVTTGEFQYPLPDRDNGYLKATFNLDQYCSRCGIGKIQNAQFRLREPKQLNTQFWGLHWEHDAIFVRPFAKKLLEEENVQGLSFTKPKLHQKNIDIENLFQVNIETTLKPGLIIDNCQIVTCKYMNEEQASSLYPNTWKHATKDSVYCGRVKYHFPHRGGLTFDKSIFNGMPDIVKTSEWFGSGASAFQLPLFSKRLKLKIEKSKMKGLKFTPLFHGDEWKDFIMK